MRLVKMYCPHGCVAWVPVRCQDVAHCWDEKHPKEMLKLRSTPTKPTEDEG